jgi:hypothetical protein
MVVRQPGQRVIAYRTRRQSGGRRSRPQSLSTRSRHRPTIASDAELLDGYCSVASVLTASQALESFGLASAEERAGGSLRWLSARIAASRITAT